MTNILEKQIDIIISSDFTLQFKNLINASSKSFNCIEGCYSVFSVKSMLDKPGIEDSIYNLASVPLLENISSNPLVRNVDKLEKQIPLRVIFSYKGGSPDNVLKNLVEYQEKEKISTENMPDLIIVNNKFYAWKNNTDVSTIEDNVETFHPYGTYFIEDGFDKIGGVALLHLLTMLQKILNISSIALFNFSKYYDKVYEYMYKNK